MELVAYERSFFCKLRKSHDGSFDDKCKHAQNNDKDKKKL